MTNLATMSWPDVDSDAILVVPVGSTEQHGPHLPIGTDTIVAEQLARELATDGGVVVAPALPFGSSGEHSGFPGTLSIGQRALRLVLVELVRTSSFRRTLFVNGHGGNVSAIAEAVDDLRDEGHDTMSWAPRVAGGDAHAGHVETSLLLALDPTLVDLSKRAPGNVADLGELMPALRAGQLADIAPNGVLGDPTRADVAAGQQLWAQLYADLRAAVAGRWPR